MFKRAAVFLLLLALSVPLFPRVVSYLHHLFPAYIENTLFFWPRLVLIPRGFYDKDIGHSEAFLAGSGIYLAIVFWSLFSIAFGYAMRNLKVRYTALSTYPAAYIMMFAILLPIELAGYGVRGLL